MQTEASATALHTPAGTVTMKRQTVMRSDENLEDREASHTPVGVGQHHHFGEQYGSFSKSWTYTSHVI